MKDSVKKEEESPFVKSVSALSSASQSNAKKANDSKKKPKKKKKQRADEDPFAAPKSKKQKQTPAEHQSKANTETPAVKAPPKQRSKSAPPPPTKASFRSLDLPVASFSSMDQAETKKEAPEKPQKKETVAADAPKAATTKKEATLPLPTSTPTGRKWLKLVQKTREHPRYKESYDLSKYKAMDEKAGYANNAWVETKPFDAAVHTHCPQAIAIDCEMCETKDPVSGQTDPRALCRISVVDVETDEVLLDSLVKPSLPVRDHRTWVNGIAAEHLENVQFTLRHAQAYLMALCSQETIIFGHAVHNDLAALRVDHPCVADSACLFSAVDSETATVALRDLATCVLKTTMPEKHDSVNDARIAFQCLKHYHENNGKVEKIARTPRKNKNAADFASQLFVHRIPKDACDETQLAAMFLAHTHVQPVEVDTIDYAAGTIGKTHVHFASDRHGNLAFDSLEGKAMADASGRLQKKVYLRNGNYIRVRKMAFEPKTENSNEVKDGKDDKERRLSS